MNKHQFQQQQHRHQLVVGAMIVASLGAVSACSSASSSKTTPSRNSTTTQSPIINASTTLAPIGEGATIVIKTFQFAPSPTTVSVGTITVRNDDNTTHTFTSDEAGLFSVELKGPNASKSVTIPKGTHKYHCAIHTSMTGEITVS